MHIRKSLAPMKLMEIESVNNAQRIPSTDSNRRDSTVRFRGRNSVVSTFGTAISIAATTDSCWRNELLKLACCLGLTWEASWRELSKDQRSCRTRTNVPPRSKMFQKSRRSMFHHVPRRTQMFPGIPPRSKHAKLKKHSQLRSSCRSIPD